jgi:hypothetical protein
MTERQRLPNQRAHELVSLQHGGFVYTPSGSATSRTAGWRKSSSTEPTSARRSTSMPVAPPLSPRSPLQDGAEPDELRHALM